MNLYHGVCCCGGLLAAFFLPPLLFGFLLDDKAWWMNVISKAALASLPHVDVARMEAHARDQPRSPMSEPIGLAAIAVTAVDAAKGNTAAHAAIADADAIAADTTIVDADAIAADTVAAEDIATDAIDASNAAYGSVALLVGRWGPWPGWTPFFLRTLGANHWVHFHVLGDTMPPLPHPQNVFFHHFTLSRLLDTMHLTVGVNLTLETSDITRRMGGWSGHVSAAKTNDLKPMWGEAFEDSLLRGYTWWGYLQEDVLLGDLRLCIQPRHLRQVDIISPLRMYNSSGVLMLLRNTPKVNRLWRRSADAERVLRDPTYLAFDEWWGASRDPFSAVIGRAQVAGDLWRTERK